MDIAVRERMQGCWLTAVPVHIPEELDMHAVVYGKVLVKNLVAENFLLGLKSSNYYRHSKYTRRCYSPL